MLSCVRTVEGWNTPAGMTPMTPPEVATFAALRLCRIMLAEVPSRRIVSVLMDSSIARRARSNGSPIALRKRMPRHVAGATWSSLMSSTELVSCAIASQVSIASK